MRPVEKRVYKRYEGGTRESGRDTVKADEGKGGAEKGGAGGVRRGAGNGLGGKEHS